MNRAFEKLRTFIINETGKWIELPLSESEMDEIKIYFKTDFDSLRVGNSERYFFDDYEKEILIDTENMTITELNKVATSVEKYVITRRKNAHLKKLETQGLIAIGKNGTTVLKKASA